ncbi:unnamed protein product [Calicophoron daubneyi]|uniref:G-protein coupled receptors family 1 profile domain-containing protein n=1 Tax=Calicophoron daubneyi TaxID=300641 RepID=A0AAV2T1H6_CALDB
MEQVTDSTVFLDQPSNVTAEDTVDPVKIIVTIVYPTIILLSTLGNSLIIITVIRSAAMRNITNLFIANLAASDLLMSFVSAPFTPIAFYMSSWQLPNIMCNLLAMTMGTSVYVSTLTSTAIAFDRYFLIVHPFTKRMSQLVCGIIIASVWLFAILITFPIGFYQEVKIEPETGIASCVPSWPAQISQSVHTIVMFILQFVVPCLVISACYYRVSRTLRSRYNNRIGSGSKSREREESDIRKKKRTNNMLIAMVVIFVVCWIPLHAFWIIMDALGDQVANSSLANNAFLFCHMLAMSSAVYNPFFYAWLNNNFRQELQNIVKCGSQPNNPQMQTKPKSSKKIDAKYNPGQAKKTVAECHIDNQVGTHSTRMNIADGDGGVWYGPEKRASTVDCSYTEKMT